MATIVIRFTPGLVYQALKFMRVRFEKQALAAGKVGVGVFGVQGDVF
jgi:hypothetical protein